MRSLVIIASIFVAMLTGYSGAAAQETAELAKARASMMANLSDPEASFEFAQRASAAGDYRAAIAALERMLLIRPDLANIQLELGVLYLRVGSPELAARQLEAALRSPAVPADVRARANALLAQARARTKRFVVSGIASLGARSESNANAGPDSRDVLLFGLPARLDDRGVSTSDVSLVAAGQARVTALTAGQRGNTFEGGIGLYSSSYQDRTDLDFAALSADIGIRLNYGDVAEARGSVRPYVFASTQRLGGDAYLNTAGLGVSVSHRLTQRISANGALTWQDNQFKDSATFRAARRSGDAVGAAAGVTIAAGPATLVSVGLDHQSQDSRAAFETFERTGVSVSASQALRPFQSKAAWIASATASYSESRYDAPDPAIDPARKRRDERTEFGLQVAAPVGQRFAIVAGAQRIDNVSSLRLYKYTNDVGRLELQYRF